MDSNPQGESLDPTEVPGKNDNVQNGERERVVSVVGSNMFCGEDVVHPTNLPSPTFFQEDRPLGSWNSCPCISVKTVLLTQLLTHRAGTGSVPGLSLSPSKPHLLLPPASGDPEPSLMKIPHTTLGLLHGGHTLIWPASSTAGVQNMIMYPSLGFVAPLQETSGLT